jgi:hypothetical protein
MTNTLAYYKINSITRVIVKVFESENTLVDNVLKIKFDLYMHRLITDTLAYYKINLMTRVIVR